MTKQDVIKEFWCKYDLCMFYTAHNEKDGKFTLDVPMRNEAWNNFLDALVKDGRLKASQIDRWTSPWT